MRMQTVHIVSVCISKFFLSKTILCDGAWSSQVNVSFGDWRLINVKRREPLKSTGDL